MDRNNNIPTGTKPPDEAPETMQELLDKAHNDWKFQRKDQAFMRVLSALAMMSQGVAQAMTTSEQALKVAKVALDNTEGKK